MQLSLTPVTEDDLALAAVFKRRTCVVAMGDDTFFEQWFPATRPYSMFARTYMDDPRALIALAWMYGTAIGLLEARVRTDEDGAEVGWVNNYYLEPEWRGQGLGRQMEECAMSFFRTHQLSRAGLRTHPDSQAMGFYTHMGWGDPKVDRDGLVQLFKHIA